MDDDLKRTEPSGPDAPTLPAKPTSSATGPVKVGETLGGRYLVIEELGEGGFGRVYRARDLQLDREVALKILRHERLAVEDRSQMGELLAAEAKAIARLEHPNIVPVYDAGELDGIPFLTMGLVRGHSLQEVLEDRGALGLRESVGIVRQVCEALDHAHAEGLVHRDVKPSNILLEGGARVRLVDFGIAGFKRKIRSERGGIITGTPGYMAPEVLRGKPAGPRSDLFSVGAVLWEMLVGRPAFEGEGVQEIIEKVLDEDPPLAETARRKLPRRVVRTLTRALAKDPEERYRDGASMVRALTRALTIRTMGRLAAGAALVMVLAAAITVGVWITRPLELQAELWADQLSAGGEYVASPVTADTVLSQGDRFWLERLEVNRTAYVYLLHMDQRGRVERIFPLTGNQPTDALEPGESHRIPEGQARWILDRWGGLETLFLVAARRPIASDEVDSLLAGTNREVDLLAASLPADLRGIEEMTVDPSFRQERELEVDNLLRERFPAVRRYVLVHE
jgi:hypothetical protein